MILVGAEAAQVIEQDELIIGADGAVRERAGEMAARAAGADVVGGEIAVHYDVLALVIDIDMLRVSESGGAGVFGFVEGHGASGIDGNGGGDAKGVGERAIIGTGRILVTVLA